MLAGEKVLTAAAAAAAAVAAGELAAGGELQLLATQPQRQRWLQEPRQRMEEAVLSGQRQSCATGLVILDTCHRQGSSLQCCRCWQPRWKCHLLMSTSTTLALHGRSLQCWQQLGTPQLESTRNASVQWIRQHYFTWCIAV